jgi:hypothetical protein
MSPGSMALKVSSPHGTVASAFLSSNVIAVGWASGPVKASFARNTLVYTLLEFSCRKKELFRMRMPIW